MRAPDDVVEAYRRRGMRVTPQRRAIIDAVHGSGGHVTALTVFDQVRTTMPSITLKTVYDTLYSLAGLGEIEKRELGTGAMVFDTTIAPHHHLICTSCLRIEDVDARLLSVTVDADVRFSISSTVVIARGLCANCAAHAGEVAP